MHEKAFQAAKNLFKSNSVLTLYDENKPLLSVCDASAYGV